MRRPHDAAPLRARQSGFTLVELLVVVSILSLGILIALPALEPAHSYRIDLAANELAEAIRHARGEALRTASPYGLEFDPAEERVRVFRGVLGTMPPSPLFDVVHPVSKQLYDLDFDDAPTTAGVTFSAAVTWSGACSTPQRLGFDSFGIPRCGSPWAVRMESSSLTLSHLGHTRTVAVDGLTGRVTVQ